MNRYEFIERLRTALAGKVTQSTLNDNIRYYEEYLDSEIRKGRKEEEVLEELGNPRLLAKTIIEANKQANQWGRTEENYNDTIDFGEENKRRQMMLHINGNEYNIPGWALILLFVLAAVAVIAVVTTLLKVILPILIPIVLIVLAVNIIAVLLKK